MTSDNDKRTTPEASGSEKDEAESIRIGTSQGTPESSSRGTREINLGTSRGVVRDDEPSNIEARTGTIAIAGSGARQINSGVDRRMERLEAVVTRLVRYDGKVLGSNRKILLERKKEYEDCLTWYEDGIKKVNAQLAALDELEGDLTGLQQEFEDRDG